MTDATAGTMSQDAAKARREDAEATGPMLAADGRPLKASLNRALRRQKLRALALIAPLLLFILITFVAPILDMLFRSVENQIVSETLPRTVIALQDWDPSDLPSEDTYAALAYDFMEAAERRNHTRLGSRLNYETTGLSSTFRRSGRGIDDVGETVRGARWVADVAFSDHHGRVFPRRSRSACCSAIRSPICCRTCRCAYLSPNVLMILVLLPFWTSLLVRTSAWKVLLQQQGVINDILVWIGLVATTTRLALINNQTGTIIAMTHILLPFMILPLYSVMKTIPPSYVRAAKIARRHELDGVLAGLFPAIGAGHRRGRDPRLHPVHRLLHHAGTGRRHDGHLHLEPDRLPHLVVAQLGPGGGAGHDPAGARAGALLALRPIVGIDNVKLG
jgi:putative spermidine/putrescine transport system permease protein